MSKGKFITQYEIDRMRELHKEGYKISQIANKLGRSVQAVRDTLVRAGDWIPVPKFRESEALLGERTRKFKGDLFIADGKGWWDWTDYPQWGVERPCVCKIPQWKRDFQRRGLTYFGKEYK